MKRFIQRLEAGGEGIAAALADVRSDEAKWKPDDGAWSLTEIVNHLADEEVEDFRTRVDLSLFSPDEPWPPIDPERTAIERKYNEREFEESLDRFLQQRRKSVAWLRQLTNVDWENAREHPKAGRLRAGDLLASWAAHDLLHLRQIAKRRYQFTMMLANGYSVAYAGRMS